MLIFNTLAIAWRLSAGVPLRMEIGPRDIENGTVRLVRRVDGVKKDVSVEGLAAYLKQEMDDIHASMLDKATRNLRESIVELTE